MAAPVIAGAARAAAHIAGALRARRDGGGPGPVAKLAAASAAALLVCAYCFFAAPLAMFDMVAAADAGELGRPDARGRYALRANSAGEYEFGSADYKITVREIRWYMREADRLHSYALSRWPGAADGTCKTPTWQWLWALDTVRNENNYAAVLSDQDGYRSFHESVLRATMRSREVENWVSRTVDENGYKVTRRTPGAYMVTDGNEIRWCIDVNEPITVTYWDVSYRSFKEIFTNASGTLTEEFKYYARHESADYGAPYWGDYGHAIGYYQFDVRYALSPYIDYAYASDPKAFSMLKPYTGRGAFSQYEPGLREAFQTAYEADPKKWAALQDQYEWDNYGQPAMDAMESCGVSMAGRRDALKGMCTSMVNCFGVGGGPSLMRKAGLSDSMSDAQIADALAAAVAANWAGTAYPARYRTEAEEVKSWLAQPPADAPQDFGDGYGDLQVELADNYYKATRFLSVSGSRVLLDYDGLMKRLVSMDEGAVDSRYSEYADAIIEAAYSTPSPGGNLCAMWVSQVYAAAGLGYPSGNACDQYDRWCHYSSLGDLQPGMIVAVPNTGLDYMGITYGHVGIYIGEVDGVPTVRDNVGYVHNIALDSWISTFGGVSEVRWGYAFDF